MFNVDAKRFVLMGGSAGGHLTLMTALAADEDYPPEVPLLNEKLPLLPRCATLVNPPSWWAVFTANPVDSTPCSAGL